MVALMIIDKSIVELLVITQKVHKRRLLLCTVDCCQHQISSSECVATPQQNNNSKDRVDISSPVISGIFRYTSNSFVVSSLRTRLSQRREREREKMCWSFVILLSAKNHIISCSNTRSSCQPNVWVDGAYILFAIYAKECYKLWSTRCISRTASQLFVALMTDYRENVMDAYERCSSLGTSLCKQNAQIHSKFKWMLHNVHTNIILSVSIRWNYTNWLFVQNIFGIFESII